MYAAHSISSFLPSWSPLFMLLQNIKTLPGSLPASRMKTAVPSRMKTAVPRMKTAVPHTRMKTEYRPLSRDSHTVYPEMDCFCFEIWRLFLYSRYNADISTMAANLRFPVQKKFLQTKTPVIMIIWRITGLAQKYLENHCAPVRMCFCETFNRLGMTKSEVGPDSLVGGRRKRIGHFWDEGKPSESDGRGLWPGQSPSCLRLRRRDCRGCR